MNENFITACNRNLIDLNEFTLGPLRGRKIEYDYQHLDSEDLFLQRPQQTIASLMRYNILKTLGYSTDPLNKLGTASAYKESNNKRLLDINERVANIKTLSDAKKIRILFLLQDLGMHTKVMSLITEENVQCIDPQWQAHLLYAYALSNFYVQMDQGNIPKDDLFLKALNECPKKTMIRVSISFSLIIVAGIYEENADLKKLREYAELLTNSIEDIKSELSSFSYQLLKSRCFRATAFVPMYEKNYEDMVKEMDEAENLAKTLDPQTEEEKLLHQENWIPILESRTKEAFLVQDLDIALERMLRAVNHDPFDSRMRIELGQVHFKNANYEEAYEAYTQAVRLGPPGLAVAQFMAGRCQEGLKNYNRAADHYIQALNEDPLQISSVESLKDIAQNLKDHSYLPWVEQKLNAMHEHLKKNQ